MSLESISFYDGHPASETADVLSTHAEDLSVQVEKSANYKGNWTELLQKRITSPYTRQKFIDIKKDFQPRRKEIVLLIWHC